MKKLQIRRNRKLIDLVELVRNRFRFQPYRSHSNTNISSRNNKRVLQTKQSGRFASTEDLVKHRRKRTGRNKRSVVRSQNTAEGEPCSSVSISTSPCCSCKRTFRDEVSQTSIPKELRHLLLDDTLHSDEDEDEENSLSNERICAEPVEQICDTDAIPLHIDAITNTEEPTTSTETIAEEQFADASRSCSSELRTSVDLFAPPQASSVDSDQSEQDDMENIEDHKETEDGEDTEGTEEETEETIDTGSAEDHNENEAESANPLHEQRSQLLPEAESAHLLHEQRSQLLPEEGVAADEEAGGDGHHNNSVIEIEITLTSGNDSNTNSEDDENDTDGLGDEDEDI